MTDPSVEQVLGWHARRAIGVAERPDDVPVEVDPVVAARPEHGCGAQAAAPPDVPAAATPQRSPISVAESTIA